MAGLPDCFFVPQPDAADVYIPTELCRGPWDNRAQHGGPPCALLAGLLDRFENDDVEEALKEPDSSGLARVVHPRRRHATVRLSFELLRPVPLAPLRVSIQPQKLGRQVHRIRAELHSLDGKKLVTATALRILRQPGPSAGLPVQAWAPPSACPRLVFDFFGHEVGYHRGVMLRVAGGAWGRTPIQVWGRLVVPLVNDGRPLTALESIVALSDAQSGMGVPLDPRMWTFVNPDLHVILDGDPQPGWVGFDIRSTASEAGSGVAQSALRDRVREVGRAAQTLVVRARSPS